MVVSKRVAATLANMLVQLLSFENWVDECEVVRFRMCLLPKHVGENYSTFKNQQLIPL